jgi:hypothetical protein
MPTVGPRVKVLVSISGSYPVNAALLARMSRCKLHPRLRRGMSQQEAADAFESALKAYIKCLSGRIGS